jgi:hypothetical protein
MGARVSDWDRMLYNLNPLNRRPGHTHTHKLMDLSLHTMATLELELSVMVVEEEGGVKDCAGSCQMLFCLPFLVSRQMVKLTVPAWYLLLHRVIVITGKETRNGPFLHEKKVFPREHFWKSVLIGTFFCSWYETYVIPP